MQSEGVVNTFLGKPQLLSSDDHVPHGHASQAATASLELPNFDSLSSVQSQSLKLAGRLNAANVTEEEREKLFKERQLLLDKKFEGQITQKELNKLEYVRWSLDRIEDARYGSAIDALDDSVSKYENFLSEIQSLNTQLRNFSKSKK